MRVYLIILNLIRALVVFKLISPSANDLPVDLPAAIHRLVHQIGETETTGARERVTRAKGKARARVARVRVRAREIVQ